MGRFHQKETIVFQLPTIHFQMLFVSFRAFSVCLEDIPISKSSGTPIFRNPPDFQRISPIPPLKPDGLKFEHEIPLNKPYFQGFCLLVSGRINQKVPLFMTTIYGSSGPAPWQENQAPAQGLPGYDP